MQDIKLEALPIGKLYNCHCEHTECHSEGDCDNKADFILTVFGMKQHICLDCFDRILRIELKRMAN